MQARKIVDEIFAMTKALSLTGTFENAETEGEKYAELMSSREPLVDRLIELKTKIDSKAAESPQFLEIRKILKDIREMDERHLACMKALHAGAQDAYKDVKINQKIYSGYHVLNDESTSHLFNKKQ